ncbi:hypothetical protein [uncultured Desulfuromusa sp.]|uniref:hypothetical protein n=1 Tax=uncultured Desulfuromusa sp. TaxID=219183 RepID=UPI002AA8E7EC|nr:hypothetical protein [uncultured Desulfuromusa sp.]
MKSTAIKGATGEFYVASYLSALELVVALPRGGVPSSDLLVTNFDCNKTISIQVKTATKALNRHGKYGEYLTWSVSTKSKLISETSHWYAFVDLMGWPTESNSPDIYFVPSIDVAKILKTDWNNEGATRLFFPIFREINSENQMYSICRNNSSFYKGMEGLKKIQEILKSPQPNNQADGK